MSELKKQKIEGSEVEAFGDYLINVLLNPIIARQFGSYLWELEDILTDGLHHYASEGEGTKA